MKLLRCNRCGQEQELREVAKEDNPVVRMTQAMSSVTEIRGWTRVKLSSFSFPLKPPTQSFDLCEDCREVFVLQFMEGATVAPITKTLAQIALPHQPMTDCQLVWNPGQGRFLCYHDDPELYHSLIIDNAQNVAEGVPEQPVEIEVEGRPYKVCAYCYCTTHKGKRCSSTGCECVTDEAGARTKWVTCNHGVPCGCESAVGMDNNEARCTCPCHLRFSSVPGLAPDGKTYNKPAADQPLDLEALYYCPGDCGGRIPGKGIVDHMYKAHQMAPSKKPDKAGQWIKFKTLQEWGGERLDKIGQELQAKIEQVAENMVIAGATHSIPRHFTADELTRAGTDSCGETHTYTGDCLLAALVQPVENPAPNPCGHMYPGTPCDWNHCATPGRLISQQGEDLTEAYSHQDPIKEGE